MHINTYIKELRNFAGMYVCTRNFIGHLHEVCILQKNLSHFCV